MCPLTAWYGWFDFVVLEDLSANLELTLHGGAQLQWLDGVWMFLNLEYLGRKRIELPQFF